MAVTTEDQRNALALIDKMKASMRQGPHYVFEDIDDDLNVLRDYLSGDDEIVVFSCALRISCARCAHVVCANPEHPEYADDPHEAMREHKATTHANGAQ